MGNGDLLININRCCRNNVCVNGALSYDVSDFSVWDTGSSYKPCVVSILSRVDANTHSIFWDLVEKHEWLWRYRVGVTGCGLFTEKIIRFKVISLLQLIVYLTIHIRKNYTYFVGTNPVCIKNLPMNSIIACPGSTRTAAIRVLSFFPPSKLVTPSFHLFVQSSSGRGVKSGTELDPNIPPWFFNNFALNSGE